MDSQGFPTQPPPASKPALNIPPLIAAAAVSMSAGRWRPLSAGVCASARRRQPLCRCDGCASAVVRPMAARYVETGKADGRLTRARWMPRWMRRYSSTANATPRRRRSAQMAAPDRPRRVRRRCTAAPRYMEHCKIWPHKAAELARRFTGVLQVKSFGIAGSAQ